MTWIRTLQAGEWVIVTIRQIVLFLPVQSGLEKKFEFHSSSSNVKFILQLHLPYQLDALLNCTVIQYQGSISNEIRTYLQLSIPFLF